jgi:hypothetical protein
MVAVLLHTCGYERWLVWVTDTPPPTPGTSDRGPYMKHLRIKGIERGIGQSRGGIFKLLWSPEIDSMVSIPPVYVALSWNF